MPSYQYSYPQISYQPTKQTKSKEKEIRSDWNSLDHMHAAVQWNEKHIFPRPYLTPEKNKLSWNHIDSHTDIRSLQKEDWFLYNKETA